MFILDVLQHNSVFFVYRKLHQFIYRSIPHQTFNILFSFIHFFATILWRIQIFIVDQLQVCVYNFSATRLFLTER